MSYIYRNTAGRSQKRAQHRLVIKFLIDDVTNRSRASELQDDGVHPGDVIGQKKKSAFRQLFESERVDPIKETNERPRKKMERALTGGHVRHRLSFTISARPSICQSASGHAGSPQNSIHERNCGALVAPRH